MIGSLSIGRDDCISSLPSKFKKRVYFIYLKGRHGERKEGGRASERVSERRRKRLLCLWRGESSQELCCSSSPESADGTGSAGSLGLVPELPSWGFQSPLSDPEQTESKTWGPQFLAQGCGAQGLSKWLWRRKRFLEHRHNEPPAMDHASALGKPPGS